MSGCNQKITITIPEDSLELKIIESSNGKQIVAVGAECDPHFLSGNVGRTMISESTNQSVTIKEEDWDNIFAPRIKEMELSFLRVMLLTSWYSKDEQTYTTKNYDYDSLQMRSLYQVLDTAQANNIDVNITVWLWDSDYYKVSPDNEWSLPTKGEGERVFAEVFADCIKYLIEEKGYTCIKQITPVNEPNSTYKIIYGDVNGFSYYVSQMKVMDEVFKEKGIRNKVLFNLSDDARSVTWLEMTLSELEGVYDIVNSHSYDFDENNTNKEMVESNPFYNYKQYSQAADQYGIVHMFSEFGTNTVRQVSNWREPSRGLQVARVALNMLQSGSAGFSYWMLFGQYYEWEADDEFGNNMGLWGSIAEDYNCRPVYYAYSLLTRFAKKDMEIYLCPTVDDNIVAVALKNGDDWTYLVVNGSETESKKVSFGNYGKKYAQSFNKYVYDQNNVPTDNKQIASSGVINADGRVLTETLQPLTFTVYTTLGGM
jgi:alpha-galactosidase